MEEIWDDVAEYANKLREDGVLKHFYTTYGEGVWSIWVDNCCMAEPVEEPVWAAMRVLKEWDNERRDGASDVGR